jgi:hypothetical protein
MLTPIVLNGYVQWVHPWRAEQGQSVYLYGEDYNSPYCPIQFEVRNDSV